MNPRLVELPRHLAKGASLVVAEGPTLPFMVQRAYWVQDADPTVPRGGHAHRTAQALLICLTGAARITLWDGQTTTIHGLDRPDLGLLIPPLHWLDYALEAGATLLVLADTPYDPDDVVRERRTFSELRGDAP